MARGRGWRSWWPIRAWLLLTYRAGSVHDSMRRPVRPCEWQRLADQTNWAGMPFVRLSGMTVPVVAVVDLAALTGQQGSSRGAWSAPRQREGSVW